MKEELKKKLSENLQDLDRFFDENQMKELNQMVNEL